MFDGMNCDARLTLGWNPDKPTPCQQALALEIDNAFDKRVHAPKIE